MVVEVEPQQWQPFLARRTAAASPRPASAAMIGAGEHFRSGQGQLTYKNRMTASISFDPHFGFLSLTMAIHLNERRWCTPPLPEGGQSSSRMSLAAALDICADETLLAIATALPTAADLLKLVLTCKAAAQRFYYTTTCCSSCSAARTCRRCADTWSIAEEASRRWVREGCSAQERGWVPRRGQESWLALMREVEMLRPPPTFGRRLTTKGMHLSHALRFRDRRLAGRSLWGPVMLSEGGALATMGRESFLSFTHLAATKAVMRAGRHYAELRLVDGCNVMLGVSPLDPASENDCWYHSQDGHHTPVNGRRSEWEGMEGAKVGDSIGLLLDLDEGSMTVFKNGKRLGVMVASGLCGEYCWAVELGARGDSVRIEPAATPST